VYETQAHAASTYLAPTDNQIASQVNTTGSATNVALGRYTAAGVGDETAALNSWLAAPSPLGVKRLVGNPTISAPLIIPSKTILDAQSAKITLASGSN
jgi:hypothetical protein